MDSLAERRFYPRVQTRWPVLLVSPLDLREGETQNLSIDGAFIRYSELPDLSEEFEIVFKPPEQRSIVVIAEKIWSANFNFNSQTVFSGMGVRFIKVFDDDRELLDKLIVNHIEAKKALETAESRTGHKANDCIR